MLDICFLVSLKYFANATDFYVKNELLHSFLFHFSTHSYPEQRSECIRFHTSPPWESNTTLALQAPCSTNWATSHHTITNHLVNYCIVHRLYLHREEKTTGTNLDFQPMYKTIMYILIKLFVRMVN